MSNKLYKIISIIILICLSLVTCNDDIMNNSNLEVNVPGSTLVEKLNWLDNNATSNTTYLIMVENNESLNPYILFYNGNTNVNIRIHGNGKTSPFCPMVLYLRLEMG